MNDANPVNYLKNKIQSRRYNLRGKSKNFLDEIKHNHHNSPLVRREAAQISEDRSRNEEVSNKSIQIIAVVCGVITTVLSLLGFLWSRK